jgi:hypothetical protein
MHVRTQSGEYQPLLPDTEVLININPFEYSAKYSIELKRGEESIIISERTDSYENAQKFILQLMKDYSQGYIVLNPDYSDFKF